MRLYCTLAAVCFASLQHSQALLAIESVCDFGELSSHIAQLLCPATMLPTSVCALAMPCIKRASWPVVPLMYALGNMPNSIQL